MVRASAQAPDYARALARTVAVAAATLILLWLVTTYAALLSDDASLEQFKVVDDAATVEWDAFVRAAHTGDLILARGAGSVASAGAALLAAPVTHAALLLVIPAPRVAPAAVSASTAARRLQAVEARLGRRVLLWESAPFKGTRVRPLSEYLDEGVRLLLWRALALPHDDVVRVLADPALLRKGYSFRFLREMSDRVLHVSPPPALAWAQPHESHHSMQCAELVGEVYVRLGVLPSPARSRSRIFPPDFLLPHTLRWSTESPALRRVLL